MYRPAAWSPQKLLARWSAGPACHRTLFSLPDLSHLSPWNVDPETQTYHERKILPYTQKELYDVVADVGSYHRFIPFCTGSRIVTSPSRRQSYTNGDAQASFVMEAELAVGFLTFTEKYTSQVTCKPYESVQAAASSTTPLFKTLTSTWHFQPASTGSLHPFIRSLPPADHQSPTATLVTLDLTYAFASPMYASISSAFFGQVSKLMVKAFEQRCLNIYGPGSN